MLTNYTLVQYRREAQLENGQWAAVIDGGVLLNCGHKEAVAWLDAYKSDNPSNRFSYPHVKQLTEQELKSVMAVNCSPFLSICSKNPFRN